ncbi:MAG: ribokinase [Roseovarius sp.]|nr:ribokinase [Roseovarius sp.]
MRRKRVYCLGSINVDYFYRVPHLVRPGETLAAVSLDRELGGKGANQSIAAARAGSEVHHIGSIGNDGHWLIGMLEKNNVWTKHVQVSSSASTGHAIITVEKSGENQIVLFPGANRDQSMENVTDALGNAKPGDWLLMQNETTKQLEVARSARKIGMDVAYSAAPFDVDAVLSLFPFLTLLIMNEIEAEQMSNFSGMSLEDIPVPYVMVTRGARGGIWIDTKRQRKESVAAFSARAVDTTGAGDTFAGYLVAGLSGNLSIKNALSRAMAAAAIQVTRKGASEAIPMADEVVEFMNQ